MKKTGNDTSKKINDEIKNLKAEITRINQNHDMISDRVLTGLLEEVKSIVKNAKKY